MRGGGRHRGPCPKVPGRFSGAKILGKRKSDTAANCRSFPFPFRIVYRIISQFTRFT